MYWKYVKTDNALFVWYKLVLIPAVIVGGMQIKQVFGWYKIIVQTIYSLKTKTGKFIKNKQFVNNKKTSIFHEFFVIFCYFFDVCDILFNISNWWNVCFLTGTELCSGAMENKFPVLSSISFLLLGLLRFAHFNGLYVKRYAFLLSAFLSIHRNLLIQKHIVTERRV